jgi:hypothetical protein
VAVAAKGKDSTIILSIQVVGVVYLVGWYVYEPWLSWEDDMQEENEYLRGRYGIGEAEDVGVGAWKPD